MLWLLLRHQNRLFFLIHANMGKFLALSLPFWRTKYDRSHSFNRDSLLLCELFGPFYSPGEPGSSDPLSRDTSSARRDLNVSLSSTTSTPEATEAI